MAGDDAVLLPDFGAAETPVPEDGAEATRGLELAVGDVDLLGGMPKRAKAESAVSLGGEVVVAAGADLVLGVTEGKLLILEAVDKGERAAFPLRGEGAVALLSMPVGVDGKAEVDAACSGAPAFMGCKPANGSAGSYNGAPRVGYACCCCCCGG